MGLDNIVTIIKNVWFLVGTVVSSTAAILVFFENNSALIFSHIMEIIVVFFSIMFIAILIFYRLLHKKVKRLDTKIDEGFKSMRSSLLISDIESFYEKHINYESLRMHQVRRLHDLENNAKELGLDEHHMEALQRLLNKPVDGTEYYR